MTGSLFIFLSCTQSGVKALRATVHITRHVAAGARVLRPAGGIGGVPVEPLLQGACRDLQGTMTHGCFQGFEIKVFNGLCAQKILNLFDQADLQRLGERRFF